MKGDRRHTYRVLKMKNVVKPLNDLLRIGPPSTPTPPYEWGIVTPATRKKKFKIVLNICVNRCLE